MESDEELTKSLKAAVAVTVGRQHFVHRFVFPGLILRSKSGGYPSREFH